jgi:hypothetical protein
MLFGGMGNTQEAQLEILLTEETRMVLVVGNMKVNYYYPNSSFPDEVASLER